MADFNDNDSLRKMIGDNRALRSAMHNTIGEGVNQDETDSDIRAAVNELMKMPRSDRRIALRAIRKLRNKYKDKFGS